MTTTAHSTKKAPVVYRMAGVHRFMTRDEIRSAVLALPMRDLVRVNYLVIYHNTDTVGNLESVLDGTFMMRDFGVPASWGVIDTYMNLHKDDEMFFVAEAGRRFNREKK